MYFFICRKYGAQLKCSTISGKKTAFIPSSHFRLTCFLCVVIFGKLWLPMSERFSKIGAVVFPWYQVPGLLLMVTTLVCRVVQPPL